MSFRRIPLGVLPLACAALAAAQCGPAHLVNAGELYGAGESSSVAEQSTAGQAARAAYVRLPLGFEANVGQTDPRVRYVSRGSGYTLFLTDREAVLSLQGGGRRSGSRPAAVPVRRAAVRMRLMGANAARIAAREPLPGVANYLLGSDPSAWRTGVRSVSRVVYEGVYPGVDLAYYGDQRTLEYDLAVAPGADPTGIRVRVDADGPAALAADGSLRIPVDGGEVVQAAPVAYQQVDGVRREVEAAYRIAASDATGVELAFRVGEYDRSRPLVIDPKIQFGTYLGGSGMDDGMAIAVDEDGSSFVAGATASLDLPTTAGTAQGSAPGGWNAFVTKLNAPGSGLVFSTYLGGSGDDTASSIGLIPTGDPRRVDVVVGGWTGSVDFPTTAGANQPEDPDAEFDDEGNVVGNGLDGFVTRLNDAGNSLLYSSYVGGNGTDRVRGLAVGLGEQAFLTGDTDSPDFPNTDDYGERVGAQGGYGVGVQAFLTVFNTGEYGGGLAFATTFGGSGDDAGFGIALDGSQAAQAYITGPTTSLDLPVTPGAFQTEGDAAGSSFVMKIQPLGANAGVRYLTYLGSPGDGRPDTAYAIGVGSTGSAYVTGVTRSPAFPTTGNAFQPSLALEFRSDPANGQPTDDVFLSRLTPAGDGLIYSTFYGGSGDEVGLGIAQAGSGTAYITGQTTSLDLPLKDFLWKPKANRGMAVPDVFVAQFDTKASGSASFKFGTYLGTPGPEVGRGLDFDACRNIYVTGSVGWPFFQATVGAFDSSYNEGGDAFVVKITPMEISGLVVTGLTPDSATITWSTPCPSTSEVHYGLTNRYGQTAMGDGDTTVHSVTLTGLTPRTRYHFRARSETVDTASATSQDRTFVTPAAGEPELDVSLGFDRARSSRELILQVSIRNDGTQDATNVQILRATVTVGLRTRGTTNILPRNLGTIPIGGSVETELKFPLLQGRPGDRAIVKLSGVHDDGSFSKRKRLRIPER